MTLYADASVLLKRYVDEPDSDRAVELLAGDDADAVTTVFIHGNRIDHCEAFSKGWNAYRRLVACADDPEVRDLARSAPCRVVTYGLVAGADWRAVDIRFDENATHFSVVRQGALGPSVTLPLAGRHNVANVLTAACCSLAAGASFEAMRQSVLAFTGVAHRLEVVRQVNGVTYVNDSIATSPEPETSTH